MTTAEARARIETDTQWKAVPVLTEPELVQLVGRARVADGAGLRPGAVGYVDTFTESSLNRAVAAGWLIKAGRVAGNFDLAAGDGVSLKRGDVHRFCKDQAAIYRRLAGASLGVLTLTAATR